MQHHTIFIFKIILVSAFNEEPCRSLGGFCLSSSKCPEKNYVSGKCPSQASHIRCCLSLPYQEDACRRSSGICADEVQCVRDGGITSPRKCPTQPSGIKCCVQGELQLDSWKTMDLGRVCACWNRALSEKVASEQYKESLKYENSINQASVKYGIPADIIKGIISRESGFGTLLGKWGNKPGWGDHNNAFGLMQIDKRYHKIDESSIDNIDDGVKILTNYLRQMKKKKPDWSLDWQLRGAVASYNFGPKNVQTKAGIDIGSASSCTPCDGNYSWDTMARAQWFAHS